MKLNEFRSELSFGNKVLRLVWGVAWFCFFLPTPRPFHAWRRILLRLFGAEIEKGVRIYGTAKIYYPPNLTMKKNSIVGPHVDIYCLAPISIGENSMISQYSYICAASHDYTLPNLPLVPAPITIEDQTWVCAKAFIGPGVTVGSGVVVAACAVVVKDIGDNQVVGGNPAKLIKKIERFTTKETSSVE